LLSSKHSILKHTISDNNAVWELAFEMLDSRKKAEIFHDLTRQIVASAQDLALCHLKLQCFVQSTNESWDNSILFFLVLRAPGRTTLLGSKERDTFSEDKLGELTHFIRKVAAGGSSSSMTIF
jgi:hypothetical protein